VARKRERERLGFKDRFLFFLVGGEK